VFYLLDTAGGVGRSVVLCVLTGQELLSQLAWWAGRVGGRGHHLGLGLPQGAYVFLE